MEKDSDWQREKTTKYFRKKAKWIQLASRDGVHRKWRLWQEERILQRVRQSMIWRDVNKRAVGDGCGLKQELEFPVYFFTGGELL